MGGVANVPDYRLVVDGKDLTPTISGFLGQDQGRRRPRLVSLTITEQRAEAADQLDLTLDDSDGLLALPRIGARLQLQLGWKQGSDVKAGLVDKGSFIVDSIEHSGPPDALTIRARSADFTGGLTARREQSWHDTTIGAVVGDVAKRQGLTGRCAPALAGIEVSITQSRESDMALLRRLGRENDAVATIKHGALIFSPLGSATTATGKPIATVTIRRQDGDRHTFSIEKRDEATGVTASWHDVGEAKKKKVEVGSDGRRRHLARVYASEYAARRAASSEQTRLAREPVKLRFDLALGRPEIIPATRVAASGFKAAIDAAAWLVSGATHSLTPEGLTTALEMEAATQ